MFTSLARGYGTLNGELKLEAWVDHELKEKSAAPLFPSILSEDLLIADHKHGITVSPRVRSAYPSRAKSAMSFRSVPPEKPDGEMQLPKTFITRKGALLIFTNNELEVSEKETEYLTNARKMLKHKYVDYSEKLGSLSRLTQSVLHFGDKEIPQEEDKSISDPDNKVYVGFMKELDEKGVDLRAKPGGDVNFYLRDLKSRAASAKSTLLSMDTRGDGKGGSDCMSHAGSQDTDDIESTASSLNRVQSAKSYRSVLSAEKLAASLKSTSSLYLGRPTPQAPTPIQESEIESQSPISSFHSRAQSGHSRPHSGKSSGKSRPHSGKSRPVSGRSHAHSKSSIKSRHAGASVTEIPEGIDENHVPADHVVEEHQSVHGSIRSRLSSRHVDDALINEFDGMPDVFGDGQSVASSLMQEQDILLPHEQDDGIDEAATEGYYRASAPASRYSRKSSRAGSLAGGDGEADVFNAEMGGAAQPLLAAYQGTGLMSQASGTFSLGDTQADTVKEEDVVIDECQSLMLSHKDSIISESRTPQDETLADLKGLRSGRTSAASSHSGMATERAKTVLAEEGISTEGLDRRRTSSASLRQPHPPGEQDAASVHGSRPGSAHTRHSRPPSARPGSASVVSRSRPGSSSLPRSRPSSSRPQSGTGGERDTPAPPSSPALSRTQSPRLEEVDDIAEVFGEDTDSSEKIEESKPPVAVEEVTVVPETSKTAAPAPSKAPVPSKSVSPDKENKKVTSPTPPSVAPKSPSVDAGKKSAPLVTKSAEKKPEDAPPEVTDEVTGPGVPEVETQMDRVDRIETKITSDMLSKNMDKKETKTNQQATPDKSKTSTKEPKPQAKDKSPAPKKKEYTKSLDINQVSTPNKNEKKGDAKKAPASKPTEKPKKDLMSELADLYKDMPKEEKKPAKADNKEKSSILKKTSKPPTPIIPVKTKEEEEYEALQKEVGNILESTGPDNLDEDSVGFSPEELELQKRILEEKMAKAQERLKGSEDTESIGKGKGKNSAPAKGRDKSPPKKAPKKKTAVPAPSSDGEKKSLEEQREALREAKKIEKLKRLEDAKQLEQKIKNKEAEKQKKMEESKHKKQKRGKSKGKKKTKKEIEREESIQTEPEVVDEIATLMEEELRSKKAEAAAAKEAEEEAREMLAANRKLQREEREAKRKAEIERRKEAAATRRADQKKREEAARKREVDMLMRIADVEEKRRIQEEERKRKEEEEEREQEKREEDERAALKSLEEEEERIAELEKQAEEEAMARLIAEREEADKEKWLMEEEARKLAEEEDKKRRELEEEQRRLEAEAFKREEDEAKRREQERLRLIELQKMEEQARDQMRVEMERRRDSALRRREVNLDRRSHLDGLKNGQGVTKPWVFSYYVLWRRETYERLMGGDPKKKKGFRPAPKKPKPAT